MTVVKHLQTVWITERGPSYICQLQNNYIIANSVVINVIVILPSIPDIPEVIATDVSSDAPTFPTPTPSPSPPQFQCLEAREMQHFCAKILAIFWRLHTSRPANPMIAPACLPGNHGNRICW